MNHRQEKNNISLGVHNSRDIMVEIEEYNGAHEKLLQKYNILKSNNFNLQKYMLPFRF